MDYISKIQEAQKAGYSNQEIVDFLGSSDNKVKSALSAGYNPDEIISFLNAPKDTIEIIDTPVVTDTGVVAADTTTTVPYKPALGLEQAPEGGYQYLPEPELEEMSQEARRPSSDEYVSISGRVDPMTGETVFPEPQGLETDIPMMFGKLATVRFLTPEMEASLGINAAKVLSKEAQIILSRNPEGLKPEEAIQVLQGVPKEDQALALSYRLGHETIGNIKHSLDVAEDRIALANELIRRKDKLLDSIGPVDVKAAKAKYADMVETIANSNSMVVHDATSITNDLDFLEKFYGTTPSKANSVVNQMKTVLEDNPKLTLSEALEFRGDINYLISRASRGKEKVKLNSIKDNIDGFINQYATKEQKVMIDEAISTYSRTMNNRDLLELINKSVKNDRAIDWVKLDKALTDSNLKSPEVNIATNIVKEFSVRFKNDAKLLTDSTVKGSNPDSGGVLGAWGFVINQLKDKLALWGNRHDNLRIQSAILKSLRNSKTSLDFVDDIVKNTEVPKEISKVFEDAITKNKVFRASSREFGESKGAMGKGTYYFEDEVNAAKRADITGSPIHTREIDTSKVADFNQVQEILGRPVTYEELRKPSVQKKIKEAGFIGVKDLGEMVIY